MPRKKINPADIIPLRQGDGNWSVESPRSGNTYTVLEWGNGQMKCTCPAQLHGTHCWHLECVACQIARDLVAGVRDPAVEIARTWEDAYSAFCEASDEFQDAVDYDFPWEQSDNTVDSYDYAADDLAFDAWRERGYR